jgi:3-hydroxybutyryl-CoA dehydratase
LFGAKIEMTLDHFHFKELKVGDQSEMTKTFSHQDVVDFARISGDYNPIHLDEEFASRTRFGRCIAHGMLISGLISAVLGTQLPGHGSIFLSQKLTFRAPVFIGDSITAVVEIISLREDKRIVTLKTTCKNQSGQVVIDGEAVLLAKS